MKRDAQLADMRHGRRLPDVEELLRSDTAAKADLKLVEVVVLVLYTGPMVREHARTPHRVCILGLDPIDAAHATTQAY